MDTRRYAKRQLTWFRNQMKDWPWARRPRLKKRSKSSSQRIKCGWTGQKALKSPLPPV